MELSLRSAKHCANCVDPSCPSNGGPITVLWASRPCGPAGWLAMLLIKAGNVETNPGPTTTHTSHTRAPTAPCLTIQIENTTSITSTIQTHTILQHSNAQNHTIFNNGRYTTNIPTDPYIVTTTRHKTNMRHIHTSIVSRHIATGGNNKILRTPPPHISSSEEILPRLTRRSLAQLRTNKSSFLKSYLRKVDAKSHPSPLCPLCNTHAHGTHNLFNCTNIRTTLSVSPGFGDRPRWSDGALGQME